MANLRERLEKATTVDEQIEVFKKFVEENMPDKGEITHESDNHVNDWSYYDDGYNQALDDVKKGLGIDE